MAHLPDPTVTLADLAQELDRCDLALIARPRSRIWKQYRRAVWDEIRRRDPVPPDIAAMTADAIAAELD